MRTAVNIKDYRVFLVRIEILWLDESVVVVELAVRALDCAESDLSVCIVKSRIFSDEEVAKGASVAVAQVCDVRNCQAAPCVYIMSAVWAHLDLVPSLSLCKTLRLAYLHSSNAF